MKRILMVTLILGLPFYFLAKSEQQGKLSIPAAGIEKFEIECGAGFLHIEREPDAQQIVVRATLEPGSANWEKVKKYEVFDLKQTGNKAVLVSKIVQSNGFWEWLFERKDLKINLTITVPQKMDLSVNDGSGDIEISHLIGNIDLDDGSGNLKVQQVSGKLRINDGSGDLTISKIQGPLYVEDSSGEIEISSVQGDLEIYDSSGDLSVSEVDGTVIIADGSGAINLDHIDGDVNIEDDRSGTVNTNNISGKVIHKSDD